ncbi:MAG: hypothetical protein O3C21_15405, partial [Verrucomicrobia bacterium]|nr:hypothetical protein [Verrucomicrobiota bacterium]
MSSRSHGQDNEIGFIERFALAADRADALKELIPGTENYYFFHALHYQNIEDRANFDSTLAQWRKRFEQSPMRKEIENRDALISYKTDPKATLDYLKRELGLVFEHQRELQQTNPDVPTKLDPAQISLEAIVQRSLGDKGSLGEVSVTGVDWLMWHWGEVELSVAQQRELLAKLSRPDYPKLVAALAEDFTRNESRGFGEFTVHGMLLPEQLDELAEARPELLNDMTFVLTKLGKMRPGADTDIHNDPIEREAYLERAWAFVSELQSAFHSLKAHVLFQRLVHDQGKGIYNTERFLAYLQLPRPVAHVNPKYREQLALWSHPVDFNFDASAATGFPPVQSDESLVRAYLLRLLAGQETFAAYAPYLTDDYLKGILAEANIVSGHGDPEKWSSLLSPSAYQELKDRVDLDFDPSCKERFDGNETVTVEMHVKNVQNLIVKIYEVNTFNYYQSVGSQLNTDLNLDGLVANEELTFDYETGNFQRIARTFEFPQLQAERGVWVIEFIGNGKSSRALVRRGNLQYITRTSTAGNVIRILDDKRQPVPGAYAWLNGKRFDQDEEGEIAIPFSNQPGSQQIILADGNGFATLGTLSLQGETYGLTAGFYIDREQLLAGSDATLAVRPNFTLNGAAADVALLDEVTLTIVSTDLDGVQSTATVPDFKLFAHKESTHRLHVPDRLASLQFQLSAKVKNLSRGTDDPLATQDTVAINQIAATDAVADLFLEKIDGSYFVKLLGRTGEPQKNIAVNFSLRRDDFRVDVGATLKTDDTGSIDLGALDGIFRVRATAPNGRDYRWELPADQARYPSTIHARVGEAISLPVMTGRSGSEAFSLLEVANGSFVRDQTKAISVAAGFATVRGLQAGDYHLLLKDAGTAVTIRVTAGEETAGFLLSAARNLEKSNPKLLHIRELKVEGDELKVTVDNAHPRTRIHVFSSRFVPAFDAFDTLGAGTALEPLIGTPSRYRNLFVSGRSIGDEYRYIIERRFATKFPGNMLKRPGLLLNPWALRDTATAKDEAQSGDDWQSSAAATAASLARDASEMRQGAEGKSDPHNLDFLAESGSISYNLAPGDDGIVRIKLEELGDRQYVRVLAVDTVTAVERQIALPARDTGIKDLRLANGLNPKRHFTQQDQVTILEPNKAFVIDDVATASFEVYETIGSVYQLLKTLSGGNATLNEFSFIVSWPDLEAARKRELYSKYACHELSFFLQRKDPGFFADVVLPYLRNKKDKTFIDH